MSCFFDCFLTVFLVFLHDHLELRLANKVFWILHHISDISFFDHLWIRAKEKKSGYELDFLGFYDFLVHLLGMSEKHTDVKDTLSTVSTVSATNLVFPTPPSPSVRSRCSARLFAIGALRQLELAPGVSAPLSHKNQGNPAHN